jgi:glycosyltransferase involved in cell wall biosynthesis
MSLEPRSGSDVAALPTDVLLVGPGSGDLGGIRTWVDGAIVYLSSRTDVRVRLFDEAAIKRRYSGRPWSRSTASLGLVWAVGREVRRTRPQVVHFHVANGSSVAEKALLAGVSRSFGASALLHFHGGYAVEPMEEVSGFGKRLVKWALRYPNSGVVLSDGYRAFLSRLIGHDSATVISNPVDLVPVFALPAQHELVVGFIGALYGQKGEEMLVDAVARVSPPIRLRLAGSGRSFDRLQRRIADAGLHERIELLGHLDPGDRASFLSSIDLFVLPSKGENLPITILEAMAAGRAVVASRVGAVEEVVIEGETGWTFAAGDVVGLAAILSTCALERSELVKRGSEARRAVERNHTWEAIGPRLTALYVDAGRRLRASSPSAGSIVFVAGTLGTGGAERQLVLLTAELVDRGFTVDVVALDGTGPARSQLEANGVRVTEIESGGKFGRLREVARAVRTIKPAAVVGWHFYAGLYAAVGGRLARVTSVATLRSSLAHDVRGLDPLMRRASIAAPKILAANSYGGVADLEAAGRTAFLLPNVVDPNWWIDVADARDIELRRIAEDRPVVVVIGRLSEEKRVDRLIDALGVLAERGQPWTGLVVGSGPLEVLLRKRARERGLGPELVHFAGAQSDVRPYLRVASAVVVPSDVEGTSNVLLEAALAGVAVVATDVGDNRRLIDELDCGRIVSKSAEAIAEVLAEWATSPDQRRSFTVVGSRRVRDLFSPQRAADILLAHIGVTNPTRKVPAAIADGSTSPSTTEPKAD